MFASLHNSSICTKECLWPQNIPQMAVKQEVTGSLSLFSSQVTAIEGAQAELLEVVEMSRLAAEHQAEALIRQLELEVKELRRKETALDELTQSEDSMQCLMVSETCWWQNVTRLLLPVWLRGKIYNILGSTLGTVH